MIDKLNEEAIKKYQQTHDPYEQLQEVVEKNGTKYKGGNDAEPMSTLEKELLETYEEMFGEKNRIILKSGIYPNDVDKSNEKSLSGECTDTNNTKLATTKGKDKYLKHLKGRCTRGIYISSLATVILTYLGLKAAKAAATTALNVSVAGITLSKYACHITIFNMFDSSSIIAAFPSNVVLHITHFAESVSTWAMSAFSPYGITALVLLILTVALIILYIWLYRRRKNSWKHA
ncbi:hypothetical protein PFTANZ_02723 [Plasmodium falciparum Tanzania (2000708)]|uniref:Surface antigen n=1 Tax=Plasmodium falciparum Tanzania (2000708) TaxID=1036725 RepID=A0A024W7K6_PLAFA|nr:hypothetical protein PFTANZ_02723 [Plasmodium falciparum Tanzania (2000708)]